MTLRRLALLGPIACGPPLAVALGLSSALAQQPRRHSAEHFEFRARAERAEAYPFNYARSHLPHLLELWHGNRDGDLRFQVDFRELFLSTGAAVFAETAWTELDPRFFFGFFADKHYTEDTASGDDEDAFGTSRFREVGIFNIPAGPPIHCESTERFRMIFGDHLGAGGRPLGEYRRDRRRLFDAHRARMAEIRRRHPGVTDPFELMRLRLQRGPEYLGCSVQPSPALIPSQEEGYNVFYDLAMRAATPPTHRGPQDSRLIHGIRRGAGLAVTGDAYAFDLTDEAWKRTDRRHVGEQMVLGFTMLDQDAASAPSDYVPARASDRYPLWAQYWRAVQAVFAWSAGSGEVESVRSRASVQGPLNASLPAWRAQGESDAAPASASGSAPAVSPAASSAGSYPGISASLPRPEPSASWTFTMFATPPGRSALDTRMTSAAAEAPFSLAPPAPSRPRAWESVQSARLRRPSVNGREVAPPYLALFRGLCSEYFDHCAAELRGARHARPRRSSLSDQHRYARCAAVAAPGSPQARHSHPYYRLLRLAHRVESSRAFLKAIGAQDTLRVIDAFVGTEAELTPAYRVITAAAIGGSLLVDDVSLESVCGYSR